MVLDEETIKTLDERIKDIIVSLNELPFCETVSSCSGHPSTDPAATPYVDIVYHDPKEAKRFHKALLKKVPYLDFRVLRGPRGESVHYIMDAEHTEEKMEKFWNGWREVLKEYRRIGKLKRSNRP
ncbi:hypothetical protein DRN62_03230 [Nanoarchaeota archaeon]|nr:MAG: hypothetical protein DRN62_03230 [Nanoarchaeota archaeon]